VTALEFWDERDIPRNENDGATIWWRNHDLRSNHVDTVHECDRQTDRIAITNTVQRIASHGKNRSIFGEDVNKSLTTCFLTHGVYSRLGGFQWHWNRWPWMAILHGSASNGLAYSGFQTKLFGNLQSYAYTFSSKNVAQGTQFPAVYGLCRYSWLPGTHWVTICVIQRLALTVSDVYSRLICFQSTSTSSALELLHSMRYINLRFTYLLTYFTGQGASNQSVVVENGDFRFFRSLSSEHFYIHVYMTIRQPLRNASVDDLGDISRSLDCFTSNFSRTVCDTAKVTLQLLIGNHTLAFDWCHFWWPWIIFEGHFTLSCPIYRKLYRNWNW